MKLNAIISDGMMFQRDCPVCVFGEGQGTVRGEFLGETVEVEADGRFELTFAPHPAGGPYEMVLSDNSETLRLRDILIGEVILLAGQSNAELVIAQTYDRDTEFEANRELRFYMSPRPDGNAEGQLFPLASPYAEKWTCLTADNARDWSAIALHTAHYFSRKLHVPVGIVNCFKGASVIESFLSEEANRKFSLDTAQLMLDHFYVPYALWNGPSYLYHLMVEKLIPFRFSSVIWYQGESNRTVYEGGIYDRMLEALVEEWRRFFRDPSLPFAIVQINLFPAAPAEAGVIAIREAQERAARRIPHCALVRIDDMGEHEKIHPENKREATLRICRALESMMP